MEWMGYSLALTASSSIVLAIAFLFIYRQSGERYLVIWSLSWVTSTLRYLLMVIAMGLENTDMVFAGGQIVSLGSAFLFLVGTYGFLQRPMPRWLVVLLSLNLLWILAGLFQDLNIVLATLPHVLFSCFVYIFTGATFIRNKTLPEPGRLILGWALIGWGIDKGVFPYVVVTRFLQPWESIAANLIIFAAAMGLLMMYFQRTREELEDSEMNYRGLIESSKDAVFLHFKGKFVYANPRFQTIFGKSDTEITDPNFDFLEHVHPASHPLVQERILSNRSVVDDPEPYEFTALDTVGNEVVFDVSESRVRFEGGSARQGILRDITERKRAEEERKRFEENLFRVQKMESIGRLAGGVAHDFNNILAGMMGYAELLRLRSAEPGTPDEEAVEAILKGTERAAELTGQLLGFARGGKYNPVPLNLNGLIQEVAAVSKKIFKKQIDVEFNLCEDLFAVEGERGQLDQVISNLLINARDAMPAGGELSIRTENSTVDDVLRKEIPELDPGDYARMSICDTGAGIPEEIRDKVFEPFFTTKGEGKGTGLGLATVYGIIKNHGGHVLVRDRSGGGTSMVIYLPRTTREIQPEKLPSRTIQGQGTVLVIDDEAMVLGMATRMLEKLGYGVLSATDGLEGVEVFKAHKAEIDVVLLDMVMPNMAGKETYGELTSIDPSVRVVLSSGYSRDEGANEIMESGAKGFIQKPYRIADLSKILDSVLH